jgi:hypothetical protein
MLQSYKTIKRAALSEIIRKQLLGLGLFCFMTVAAFGLQISGSKRGTQFFAHFSYRFLVPENQTETIRNYFREHYALSSKASAARKEEVLTEFYFDDEKQTLLKQHVVLRHRINLSGEGRKERIGLVLPPTANAATGKEVVFRHNRKPDKGAGFTTHPLLKLLRAKDRPVLDSLLQPFQMQAEDLKPVLEIIQRREQFHLQKQNSNWLTITLTQCSTADQENVNCEIQIEPDKKLLTFASAAVKKQLLQETEHLAASLKKQFPELKEQTQSEYASLWKAAQTEPKRAWSETVFTLAILALAGVVFWFFRHFKRQHRGKA